MTACEPTRRHDPAGEFRRRAAWLMPGGLMLLAIAVLSGGLNTAPGPLRDAAIRGRVVDARGPVPGARVRIKGTARTVRTDVNGRFQLPHASHDAVLAAWKPGFYIGSTPVGPSWHQITLRRLPDRDHTEYAWVDSDAGGDDEQSCIHCHEQIVDEWSASGHARAATNRRLLNLYDGSDWQGRAGRGWSLLDDYPDGASVCAACHAPTIPIGDPGEEDLRSVHGVAADGVHCDFCHKVREIATDVIGRGHGRDAMQLLRPADGQLFFGPLDDAERGSESFAAVYKKSEYCAPCHEGIVFGVPVYTTYSEWLSSPARRAGRQCQACHMAPTGRMTNIAPGNGGIERDPRTLAHHEFPGGQAAMLKKCLGMTTQLKTTADDVTLMVSVVAQDVGHRVPTGFIDRHVLLLVDAVGPGGEAAELLSGPKLEQVGDAFLSGRPGRLYAKLLLDANGRGPIPFWRDHGAIRDTRLVPDEHDVSHYAFPRTTHQVRVRLVYRRFWREVAESKGWPDDQLVIFDQSFNVSR